MRAYQRAQSARHGRGDDLGEFTSRAEGGRMPALIEKLRFFPV